MQVSELLTHIWNPRNYAIHISSFISTRCLELTRTKKTQARFWKFERKSDPSRHWEGMRKSFPGNKIFMGNSRPLGVSMGRPEARLVWVAAQNVGPIYCSRPLKKMFMSGRQNNETIFGTFIARCPWTSNWK